MNKFKNYFEFYLKIYCPKCNEPNWIYNSHSLRIYAEDVEGCECHNCQNIFWIGDEEEFCFRYLKDEKLEDLKEEEINEIFKEKIKFDKGLKKEEL